MSATVTGAGDLLLFDGDCAFCSSVERFARRLMRRFPATVPYQDADVAAFGLTAEDCEREVQWIGGDGRRAAGHLAIAQALVATGSGWALLGRLLRAPGVRAAAGLGYRWVAANRHRLPGGAPACSLSASGRTRRSGG